MGHAGVWGLRLALAGGTAREGHVEGGALAGGTEAPPSVAIAPPAAPRPDPAASPTAGGASASRPSPTASAEISGVPSRERPCEGPAWDEDGRAPVRGLLGRVGSFEYSTNGFYIDHYYMLMLISTCLIDPTGQVSPDVQLGGTPAPGVDYETAVERTVRVDGVLHYQPPGSPYIHAPIVVDVQRWVVE